MRLFSVALVLTLALGLARAAVTGGAYTPLPRATGLDVPGGQLQGTLAAPVPFDCPPMVLILAGSGPTDRDGNSALLPGLNDSLKMLAQALAVQGIATVRYDKRGVAHSRAAEPDERRLRPETHVRDAAAWVRALKREGRYASVTVLGHSEGSLIGMLAARIADADAFISLAGPAQPAGALLRRQWLPKLPPELARATDRMLSSLEHGKLQPHMRPELQAVFRPSVQPYMVSWFRYAPEREFARLRMPLLVVQGGNDMQVGLDQAWRLKQAQPGAEMALIAGMNHVLKSAPADMARQMASYMDPSWPLAPSLADVIAGFIHTAPRRHVCGTPRI